MEWERALRSSPPSATLPREKDGGERRAEEQDSFDAVEQGKKWRDELRKQEAMQRVHDEQQG